MDYFGQSVEIEVQEAALADAGVEQAAAVHARLAWALRQRDTRRACRHAARAALLLPSASMQDDARRSLAARMRLVEAEAQWLFSNAGADVAAVAALAEFVSCGDSCGIGDALLLRAHIHNDNADPSVREGHLEQAAAAFAAAGESERADVVAAGSRSAQASPPSPEPKASRRTSSSDAPTRRCTRPSEAGAIAAAAS